MFTLADVGKHSSPFSWSFVGKFVSKRPSLMQIRITLKRVRSFSQEFFVGVIDNHHVIIRFQNRVDFVNAYIKNDWRIFGKYTKIFGGLQGLLQALNQLVLHSGLSSLV